MGVVIHTYTYINKYDIQWITCEKAARSSSS